MLEKRLRKILAIDMVLTVMPQVQTAIDSAAKDLALESDAEQDVFTLDRMRREVIVELIEFLTQTTFSDEFLPDFVHPQQLSDVYYRAYWEVEPSPFEAEVKAE